MIGGDWCKALTSMRVDASATQLSVQLTCQMSHVNCRIKSRCLSCLGVYLSECDCNAKISGLWSDEIDVPQENVKNT